MLSRKLNAFVRPTTQRTVTRPADDRVRERPEQRDPDPRRRQDQGQRDLDDQPGPPAQPDPVVDQAHRHDDRRQPEDQRQLAGPRPEPVGVDGQRLGERVAAEARARGPRGRGRMTVVSQIATPPPRGVGTRCALRPPGVSTSPRRGAQRRTRPLRPAPTANATSQAEAHRGQLTSSLADIVEHPTISVRSGPICDLRPRIAGIRVRLRSAMSGRAMSP